MWRPRKKLHYVWRRICTHRTVWLMEKWSEDFLDGCDFIRRWKGFMKMNETLWNIRIVWTHGFNIHFWWMCVCAFSHSKSSSVAIQNAFKFTFSWWNWQSTEPFIYSFELFYGIIRIKSHFIMSGYFHVMAFYWCKRNFMTELFFSGALSLADKRFETYFFIIRFKELLLLWN